MKRGFLTTAKAKQQLHESSLGTRSETKNNTDSTQTPASVDISPTPALPNLDSELSSALSSKLDMNIAPEKFSYGIVPDAGLPAGYKSNQALFNNSDPNDPDSSFFVTLPASKPVSTALQETYLGPQTECCVTLHVKHMIENTPGFPSPPLQPSGGKAYRIGDAGGKGLGVFATRLIKAGDLIMDDRPLAMLPIGNFAFLKNAEFVRKMRGYTPEQIKQISLHEMDMRVKGMFDRMSPENQKAFMELHNSHKQDGSGEYIGRMRTNAGGIDGEKLRDKDTEGPNGTYCVICAEYSRLNHCCCPNSVFHWHTDTFTMRVYAVRDIPAGAEITVNYCNILDSTTERAKALAPYGITSCACSPSCSDPALAKISDERRARFKKAVCLVSPPVNQNPKDAWVEPALTRLRELEEENLQAADEYRRTLHQLVNIYCFLQDVDKVLLYAPKFHSVCRAFDRVKDMDGNLLKREKIKYSAAWKKATQTRSSSMTGNVRRSGMSVGVMFR